ncbi:DUF4865 family protein [Allostreptomyces psammosilenae]|uniref:DUF4865 domain-containing protein n=1 Tax=Allostreptomyces psammosilenae TaxID=1892865 RepID=A0A853A1V4_9ACTN|nr:DUF4865 family protein [Allostreptomyces psammosilenae]NYI04492.1 hypothetical protein [Allostreptomyces psammosilenae]
MYAMQYEITLPADYDMGVIRHRVATRGHRTDAFPGLGMKAYLLRERGVAGSPVNQYAPFYLWHSVGGMNRFLWGEGGFGGIVQDFGRPSVAHWTGVACRPGPTRAAVPRAASRRTEALPAGVDPAVVVRRALDDLDRRAETDGVHTTALAVDPGQWRLTRLTLWEQPVTELPAHTDDAPGGDHARYEVAHLSSPELDAIAVGRQW